MQEVFVVIQVMPSSEIQHLNPYLSTVLRSYVLQVSCLMHETGVLSIDFEKSLLFFHKKMYAFSPVSILKSNLNNQVTPA